MDLITLLHADETRQFAWEGRERLKVRVQKQKQNEWIEVVRRVCLFGIQMIHKTV